MQTNNSINRLKRRLLTRIMSGAKRFNERHKNSAKIITIGALILVIIISIFFQLAEAVYALVRALTKGKRKLVLLLIAVLLVAFFAVRTLDFSEKSTADSGKVQEQTAEVQQEPVTAPVDEEETTAKDDGSTEEAVADQDQTTEDIADSGEEGTEAEKMQAEASGSEDENQPMSQKSESDGTKQTEAELDSFIAQYPETVGWIYFEDGHISYPIMHCDDNMKYVKAGYNGVNANTGAIFLDSRSAADFSDPNSIVYGHNMKDNTMFGSLRDYREDPAYYNDHQFFQIITPKERLRYQIFAYMDVPETYVLYDYVGEASAEFLKDAEPVRIKSYMDSEIVVNETKRVVTLSTCTAKDERQFVVLGVLVDDDN